MQPNHLFAILPVIALSACAASSPRPAEFADAREKIDAAEVSFARSEPSSALYLELATQELGHARAALSQHDIEAARAWAKQAAADADLARSMVVEIKAREEAEQNWAELQRLEDLLNHPPAPASRSLPSSP